MKRVLKGIELLMLMSALLMLSACSNMACHRYSRVLQDADAKAELLDWGKSNIFGAAFNYDELTEGGLVGPGLASLRRSTIGDRVAVDSLSDDEIRLLGEDPLRPIGYFIGNASYRGIIVVEDNLDDVLVAERILPEEVKVRSEGMASICRARR